MEDLRSTPGDLWVPVPAIGGTASRAYWEEVNKAALTDPTYWSPAPEGTSPMAELTDRYPDSHYLGFEFDQGTGEEIDTVADLRKRFGTEPAPEDLRKVLEWETDVVNTQREIARLRSRLEAGLRAAIERGGMTQDRIARWQAEIEKEVSAGLYRVNTYNPSGNPKWNRRQIFYVTIDADHNLVRDYEEVRYSDDVTGKPKKPGKQISHPNPTLSKQFRARYPSFRSRF